MDTIHAPIADVRDRWSEMAMLIADSLAREPVLRRLAALRMGIVETEQALGEARAALATRRQEEVALERRLEVQTAAAVFWGFANPLFWLLLPLLGLSLFLRSRELEKRHQQLKGARESKNLAATATQRAANAVEEVEGRLGEMRAEYGTGVPPRTLCAVGRVALPFRRADVAGYPVLVDRASVFDRVALRLPDLAADPDTIDDIRRTAAALATPPMLLATDEFEGDELDALSGEELTLERTLGRFVEMVQSVPVLGAGLHLVPAASALHEIAQAASASAPIGHDAGAGPDVLGPESSAIDSQVEALAQVASRLRRVGGNISDIMRAMERDLSGLFGQYAELRSDALSRIHEELVEAMGRSHLTQVYYYCPKCSAVPAYLYHRLGVGPDEVHELPPVELVSRLSADPDVAARVQADPSIIQGISEAYDSAAEVGGLLRRCETALAQAAAAGVGEVAPNVSMAELEAYRSQWSAAKRTCASWFRRAVTGSPHPVISLSRRARMTFDPAHGAWRCHACESVYPEGPIAEMGRILRVREELIHPMWHHLWTEKDDFRKAELFETDRELGAMKEKESEKLLLVATQYADDVRVVREHLTQAFADAASRSQQVERAVRELELAGLLEKAKGAQILASAPDKSVDLGRIKRQALEKEHILTLEPQAQLARRPTAQDPCDLTLSPDVLFSPIAAMPAPEIAAPRRSEAA